MVVGYGEQTVWRFEQTKNDTDELKDMYGAGKFGREEEGRMQLNYCNTRWELKWKSNLSEFLEYRFVCEYSKGTSQALVAVLFRKGDKVVCFTKISIIQSSVIRYWMELVLFPLLTFARYCWRRWKTEFFSFIQRHKINGRFVWFMNRVWLFRSFSVVTERRGAVSKYEIFVVRMSSCK